MSLTYDTIGNPLSYYNGDSSWNFTWSDGRNLAAASDGTTSAAYMYDSNGQRISKTVDGVTYNYVYLGGQLTEMTWGSHRIP